MHSFRSLTEATEKLKQYFSKNSNAQGVARGDVEASIWLVH